MDHSDVAVVLTTHREGRLLIPTFRGLARSIAHALDSQVSVEVVVVRDRADTATIGQIDDLLAQEVFAGATRVQVIDVDHGDLGLSRNAGIRASDARFVGVLDADNVPSANWCSAGVEVLTRASRPSVVHPERILKFGDVEQVWPLIGSEDPRFHRGTLAWFNAWDAFALMHREVALAHPYRECRPGSGFGPEDWAFNCDTVAAGVPHLIAPRTTLYYHARSGSLMSAHAGALLPSNALLRSKEVAREEAERLGARLAASPPPSEPPSPSLAARGRGLVGREARRGARFAARLARAAARRAGVTSPAGPANDPAASVADELSRLSAEEIADWQGAHAIQPLLPTPAPRHLTRFSVVGRDDDDVALPDRFAYWSVIDQLPETVDFLMVALWVRTGGGDRMTLEHLRAVRRLRPDASIALITTEPEPSEHMSEVPDGVTVVELGRFGLWPQFTEQVLAMACTQLRPQTIHMNNSVAGFWAMERFGRAIATYSNVYLQTFCVDRYDDGSEWSFLYNRSRDYFDTITGILTDSQAFVDQVVRVQGVPRELFSVFTVVDTDELETAFAARARRTATARTTVRLLWAGRFDLQKRLDRMADISQALAARGADVEIVVRGRPVIETDEDWREHLRRASDGVATIAEPFSGGFLHAHPEEYDALLLTSDYEGVAMVALESMAAGLPVIAPLVGGMAEMIDDTVGYPVDPDGGLEPYLDAIAAIGERPDEARARASAARERVVRTSSQASFDGVLERLPAYLPRDRSGATRAQRPLRYFASPATARSAATGSDVIVYTGSNGHSNFGDVLQTKNVLAWWAAQDGRHTTLVMPAHAALPAGRAELLAQWYPADAIVFATAHATQTRGAGLVELEFPGQAHLVHVVGGGYLNAQWGGEHFPMIDAVATDSGAPIVFSGLQIDHAALGGFADVARGNEVVQVGLRDHVSLGLAREGLDLPVEFTFDDLTEIFQDWARAAQDHPRAPGRTRIAVHMNTSDYAGGARAVQMWKDVLQQVSETHPGAELLVLHAYDDARPEVRDALDTVTALAEDMPFTSFTVLDIAKASLEYRFGDGLPDALRPVLDADLLLSSSYHTALFGAFMGLPVYLMGASEYFRQKAQLFDLPPLDTFLADPSQYLLTIPEELAAREAWLASLAALATEHGGR